MSTPEAEPDFDDYVEEEGEKFHDESDDSDSMLDKARRVRTKPNASRKQEIESIYSEFEELWELLLELNDHGNGRGAGPGLAQSLGINISLLTKFVNQTKPVRMRDARMIADRLVTYLRSVDAEDNSGGITNPTTQTAEVSPPEEDKPIVVSAIEWRVIRRSDELQVQIAELIRLVGEVIFHASTANLPPDQRALTDIERAQLIAVLKTAIKVLEAPMMEKGLLKKAKDSMEKGALSAIEKGVEHAFSFSAGFAAGKLSDFIGHHF
jgi:hypothetical protein